MKKQNGFTLIEMVVVMVILGILAAVALPKFVNMTSQARTAKMNGAVGAVQSSISLIHAKWLADGSPTSGTVAYEGGTLTIGTDVINGYPAATAYANGTGAKNIAGLDTSFTVTATASPATIADGSNGSPATCSFTITNSTGTGTPPVVSTVGVC